jgi:hypothetical protein
MPLTSLPTFYRLIGGSPSDIVGDSRIEALRAIIPHLEVAEVPNSEHMVASDNNSVFGEPPIDCPAVVSPL